MLVPDCQSLGVVWCHSPGCCEATGVGVVGAVGTTLLWSCVLCCGANWLTLFYSIFTVSSRTSHNNAAAGSALEYFTKLSDRSSETFNIEMYICDPAGVGKC